MTNTVPKRQRTSQDISRRDLEVMMSTAAAYSRRLSRSFKLSRAEEEDAGQDILIILLERWHYFDDHRGSNIGFAIRIARQAVQVIAGRIVADRDIKTVGFDDLQDTGEPSAEREALSVSETLADATVPGEEAILEGLSVGRFLDVLPPDFATVAQSIREQDGDLAEAQRVTGLSTTEFYRRLRELRYRLVCLELAPRQWLPRS